MTRTLTDRTGALLPTLLLAGCLHAQAGLPATAPTVAAQQASGVSQLPSAQPATEGSAQGRVEVSWDGHLLRLSADGATLRETMHRIAAETGARIVGEVPGDRVFGTYGPAPLAVIIANLTDGLPVNVLFVDAAGTHPPQLTLTARNGAPTPPDPSSQQQAYEAPRQSEQPRRALGAFGGGPAGSAVGAPPTGAPPNQTDTPDTTTAADNGNPASPNGVKTPQEIFEQLQRLRAAASANH